MKLLTKANGNLPRTDVEKAKMLEQAAHHYGNFMTALGFDWGADPHSKETPRRVVKAWINEIISGSLNEEPKITTFPNDEGYTGLVCQTDVPVKSICAHHHLAVDGVCHLAYIPGKGKTQGLLVLVNSIASSISTHDVRTFKSL